MPQTYRVRYTAGLSGRLWAADVQTADVECALDDLPGRLPADAYVVSVEDLTAGRAVHWTLWPATFRPGSADPDTGRVAR